MRVVPGLLLLICLTIMLAVGIHFFTKAHGSYGETAAMTAADYIQIGILSVLGFTMILAVWQTRTQTNLYLAQLLRDRFEMYWKMYEPVSQGQLEELREFPEDYIELTLYEEKYKGHDKKLRKYIGMAQRYEYLAFAHGLEELHLRDPLGYGWTQRWTEDLLEDEVFMDVHHYFGAYYPGYTKLIKKLSEK